MATSIKIILPAPGIKSGGNAAGISVSRATPFTVVAEVTDGDPANVYWNTQNYEDIDLMVDSYGICGQYAYAKVLAKDNPPSITPKHDTVLDEIFASYGGPCVAGLYDYLPVYIESGGPDTCEECGKEPSVQETAKSSFVSAGGRLWTRVSCDPIRTRGAALNACLTHFNKDFQDVSMGNRMGEGSHLGLTRHLTFDPVLGDVYTAMVKENGRKAVAVRSGAVYAYPPNKRGSLIKSGDEYIETEPDGGQFAYDYYGNEIRRVEPNGNSLYFGYDYSVTDSGRCGRLQKVTGDMQVVPYFYYDANGRVTSLVVRDPAAVTPERANYFEYNADNRLVAFQGPEGCRTLFNYDYYGRITAETDPEGYTTYFHYDGDAYGRISRIDEPEGRTTYYYHSLTDAILKQQNAAGRFTYYNYNPNDQETLVLDALGNSPTTEYDIYGNVRIATDALGYSSYYQYSGYDRTSAKDALGNETQYSYGGYGRVTYVRDALGRETYYTYDSYGNQTSVKDPLGNIANFQYAAGGLRTGDIDQLSRATYFGYDSWGNMLCEQNALLQTSYYQYDAFGNRVTAIDARGNASYFEFDQRNRVTKQKNALLYSRQFGYDSRGLKTIELDELSNAAYWHYNGLSQLTCSKDSGGNPSYYAYNLVGNQIRTADPTCVTTYYHYDELNRQKCVEDGLGNKTYFEYDATGRQTRVLDPLGRAARTHYDEVGRTRCSEDALGNRTYFEYDAVGNQMKAIDPLGRSSVTYFDALNRQSCTADALGAKSYFEYNEVGNQIRVYDKRTFPTYFAYDELNRLAVQWTPEYDYGDQPFGTTPYGGVEATAAYFGYDEVGNRIRAMDARGNTAYFHFDSLNRMDWQKDAAGYFTYYEYTARSEQSKVKNPRLAEQQSVYDAAGRLTTSTDPLNVSTYFQYDAAGRRTRTHLAVLDQVTYLEYDKVGRQTHSKTTPDGSAIYDSQIVYDAAGQTVRTINPRGYAVYFEYDIVGRQQKVKDALLNEAYFGYDAVGNRILSISPRSYANYFGFDAGNRLVSSQDAENVVGYFEYDANGNRTAMVVGTGAEARRTEFAYDNLNRLSSVEAPDGGVTVFSYDKNGNRTSVRDPLSNSALTGYDGRNLSVRVQDPLGYTAYFYYDNVGNRTCVRDARANLTYFYYDLNNRRKGSVNALGQEAYFTFDAAGNRTAAVNALGRAAYFHYDRVNRLALSKDPLNANTYFTYDAAGNLTVVKDALEHTTSYSFDQLGRLASITDALGNAEYYGYDAGSNLSVFKDAADGVAYYGYDKADRRIQVGYPDSSSAYFVYNALDELSAAKDVRGWTYFTYDVAGRLASEKTPDGAITSHGWDLAGRRTRVTSPANSTYYAFDAAGQMTRAQASDELDTAYFAYDETGSVSRKKLGNGCFTYLEYDALNRISVIKNCYGDGSALAYFEYTRSAVGDILSSRLEDGNAVYFTYDDISQMKQEEWKCGASVIYAFEYDFDLMGNRTYMKKSIGTAEESYYTFDSANQIVNRNVLGVGWTYFVHDEKGNVTRIQLPSGTAYFGYDGRNKVSEIKYPSGQVTALGYDALGKLAWKTVDGTATYFTYDGLNLLAERNAAGSVTAEYTYGRSPIAGIANLVAAKIDGTAYYPVFNERGDLIAVLNDAGAVVHRSWRNAHGVLLGETGTNPFSFDHHGPVMMALKGGASDPVFHWAPAGRTVWLEIGRFLQRDPRFRLAGGYLYVKNTPTKYVDPDGNGDTDVAPSPGGEQPKPKPPEPSPGDPVAAWIHKMLDPDPKEIDYPDKTVAQVGYEKFVREFITQLNKPATKRLFENDTEPMPEIEDVLLKASSSAGQEVAKKLIWDRASFEQRLVEVGNIPVLAPLAGIAYTEALDYGIVPAEFSFKPELKREYGGCVLGIKGEANFKLSNPRDRLFAETEWEVLFKGAYKTDTLRGFKVTQSFELNKDPLGLRGRDFEIRRGFGQFDPGFGLAVSRTIGLGRLNFDLSAKGTVPYEASREDYSVEAAATLWFPKVRAEGGLYQTDEGQAGIVLHLKDMPEPDGHGNRDQLIFGGVSVRF